MPLNAKVVEIEPTGDVWDYEGKWYVDLKPIFSPHGFQEFFFN